MRFAYIDSQGNEVTIPSVDALALRIELGAIGPDTDLYDAQADRWGPAHTHEIFHTLSRDVGGDGSFVAPPPPMATPDETEPEPELEPAPESEPEEEESGLDLGGALELVDDGAPAKASTAKKVPAEPDDGGLGFDLTLTDAPGATPAVPAGAEDLAMDLTLAGAPGPAAGDVDEEEEKGGAFDFGGFGTLELEGGPVEDEAPPRDDAMDFSSGGGAFGGGMELEQPMSDFNADGDSSWMERDGPSADEGTMDFRPGSAQTEEDAAPPPSRAARPDAEDEEPAERKPRPEPRTRPSPPRRKKSFPTGMVLGVVGFAVVAGGGYFVWSTFLAGGSGSAADVPQVVALPAVTIPDIPAELLPVMRDLGEAALVDMIEDLRGMQEEFNLPVEPRNDWLAGVYLANAAQFRDVQEYWEGIESYVDRVRDRDTEVFHDKYVAQLEIAGIIGDTAAILLERADSGFLSTRDARFAAYSLMDDLVNAALDLHQFLLMNEEDIEYDPAAGGMSRDPVLEAVPNSRELGNEMWEMVDRITGALDALGTLDRVTTERLTAVLFDRIRRAGFQ